MHKTRISILLASFALSAPGAAADVPAPSVDEYAAVSRAFQAAREGRCADVMAVLPEAAARDSFAGFPEFVRRQTLEFIISCLGEARELANKIPYYQRLIDIDAPDTPEHIRELIWTSTLANQPDVAVEAVKRLATFGKHELALYTSREFGALNALLRRSSANQELRYQFLKTLFENGYAPDNPFDTADELRLDYAVMSVDRGDISSLRNLVLSLTEPGILLRVRIDRRFDALRQDSEVEAWLDLEAAAERNINRLRELVREYPHWAMGHVHLANALIGAWRVDEALAVIEPVALALRDPAASSRFSDAERNLNWVLEAYAAALFFERYPEQSEAMFDEATEVPEVAGMNINQRINLAGSLINGGRIDDALTFLPDPDEEFLNPYGRMWVHKNIVCANAMRGLPQGNSASRTYLIENEKDNPGALLVALLCTNEMDLAAERLIARVRSQEERTLALIYLQYSRADWQSEARQHRHASTAGLTPGHILWHRLDELRQREDVVDAVNRVGRIEVVPLHSSVWLRY